MFWPPSRPPLTAEVGMTGRIDIHHHIFPPWLDKTKASENVGFKTPPENLPWTPEISLRAMARLGIDLAVLSYPAGMPGGPACAENRAAARRYNEYAARICADHPGRFAFFACTPNLFDSQGVQGPSKGPVPSHSITDTGSIEEIRFAMDELNAVGVSLPSLYGSGLDASEYSVLSRRASVKRVEEYIGDDIFDTVWEELNRRSAVVFLHGAQIPSSTPCPHPLLGIPITEVPHFALIEVTTCEMNQSGFALFFYFRRFQTRRSRRRHIWLLRGRNAVFQTLGSSSPTLVGAPRFSRPESLRYPRTWAVPSLKTRSWKTSGVSTSTPR